MNPGPGLAPGPGPAPGPGILPYYHANEKAALPQNCIARQLITSIITNYVPHYLGITNGK